MRDILPAFLDMVKGTPFRWGKTDCGQLPLKWVLARMGVDLSYMLPEYDSDDGMKRLIEELGDAEAIADMVATDYNIQEIKPSYAQKGDVVLYDIPEGNILGICSGKKSWVMAAQGPVCLRTLNARRAWRIK